jgi:hypothetical protein
VVWSALSISSVTRFRRSARPGLDQFAGEFGLLVDRQAHAQAKLGVVFEQRVRPGRAAAFFVLGPRGGGQVAAVDGGAAGGIGDDGAVAEQLREQLDVGGFTAAGAGAGELKQRLQELRVLDVVAGCRAGVAFGQGQEEVPVCAFGLAGAAGAMLMALRPTWVLSLDRAGFHAQRAAGAVFRSDLQGVFHAGQFFELGIGRLEGGGRASSRAGS